MVTLLGGFLTSLILREFQYYLAARSGDAVSMDMDLIALIPIVLAMAGNAGIQSSTLLVRSIAIRGLHGRNIKKLFTREIYTGAIMGVICGMLLGAWSILITTQPLTANITPLQLAGVVAFAQFCAMTFATVFGAVVPIALHRFKVDPAIASGPFVIIANDVAALLIYFGILALLLAQIGA